MVTPLPRGYCPLCGKSVALRNGGEVREHTPAPGSPDSFREQGHSVCRGSALPGLRSAASVPLTQPVILELEDVGASLAVVRAAIEEVLA